MKKISILITLFISATLMLLCSCEDAPAPLANNSGSKSGVNGSNGTNINNNQGASNGNSNGDNSLTGNGGANNGDINGSNQGTNGGSGGEISEGEGGL